MVLVCFKLIEVFLFLSTDVFPNGSQRPTDRKPFNSPLSTFDVYIVEYNLLKSV